MLLTALAAASSTALAVRDDQVCDVAADYMLGLEKYPDAIRLHQKVLASQPGNALAHYHLGFAYGMTGRYPEEIREYVAAIKFGLSDWDLFLNLGLAYLSQGDMTASIENLNKAVWHGREHYETHFDLAVAYERVGRLTDALREISAALSLNPKDPEVHNMHAIVDVELGYINNARDEWSKLVHTVPDYVPARTNLAILDEKSLVFSGSSIQRSHSTGLVQAPNAYGVSGRYLK